MFWWLDIPILVTSNYRYILNHNAGQSLILGGIMQTLCCNLQQKLKNLISWMEWRNPLVNSGQVYSAGDHEWWWDWNSDPKVSNFKLTIICDVLLINSTRLSEIGIRITIMRWWDWNSDPKVSNCGTILIYDNMRCSVNTILSVKCKYRFRKSGFGSRSCDFKRKV